jgi:thiol-disulfide isomerase/thioredoxin
MRIIGRWFAGFVVACCALAAWGAPLAGQAPPAVGDRAPAVTINDLDGKPVDLGAVIGKKPVFLEFWATWCSNCAELLPRVREAQARYGGQVEFYGVNVTVNQTPARVRRYMDEQQPPYRVLYDDQGASIRAFGVPGTSYVVIVDAKGTIVYTGFGADQSFGDALRKATGS